MGEDSHFLHSLYTPISVQPRACLRQFASQEHNFVFYLLVREFIKTKLKSETSLYLTEEAGFPFVPSLGKQSMTRRTSANETNYRVVASALVGRQTARRCCLLAVRSRPIEAACSRKDTAVELECTRQRNIVSIMR